MCDREKRLYIHQFLPTISPWSVALFETQTTTHCQSEIASRRQRNTVSLVGTLSVCYYNCCGCYCYIVICDRRCDSRPWPWTWMSSVTDITEKIKESWKNIDIVTVKGSWILKRVSFGEETFVTGTSSQTIGILEVKASQDVSLHYLSGSRVSEFWILGINRFQMQVRCYHGIH